MSSSLSIVDDGKKIIKQAVELLINLRLTVDYHPEIDEGTPEAKRLNEKVTEIGHGKLSEFFDVLRSQRRNLFSDVYDAVDEIDQQEMVDGGWADGAFTKLRAAKANSDKGTGTRKVLSENIDLLFHILQYRNVDEEAIDAIRTDWKLKQGIWYIISEESNRRLTSCFNHARHYKEKSYNENYELLLFATSEGQEFSTAYVKNLANAAFQMLFIIKFLNKTGQKSSETWSQVKGLSGNLDEDIHYNASLIGKAEEMKRVLDRMFWGPREFVLNEESLKLVYDKLESQRIIVFHGFGAAGKTALAQKITWDDLNGEMPIERFNWSQMWTSKVGSDQPTMIWDDSEGVTTAETDARYNPGVKLGSGDSDYRSPTRLVGSSRQIWGDIVRRQTGKPIDQINDKELKRQSLEILRDNRILIIIDNFEDFQNPLVHRDKKGVGEHSSDTIDALMEEYKSIVGWLRDLQSLGDKVQSRVIITTRGGKWSRAAEAHGLDDVPGEKFEVNGLSESDAVALFIAVVRDRRSKLDDPEHKAKLDNVLMSLMEKGIVSEVESSLKASWGEKTYPQIAIFACCSLHTYPGEGKECIENMLDDWKGHNEHKEAIYRYATTKILGLVTEKEKEFLKKTLSNSRWVQNGFKISELDYANALLNNSETTEAFLCRIRDQYWMRSNDTAHMDTIWSWNAPIAESMKSELGVIETDESELETPDEVKESSVSYGTDIAVDELNGHKTDSYQARVENRTSLIDEWSKFLKSHQDFTIPPPNEPPWRKDDKRARGSEPILNRIGAKSTAKRSLRYFERDKLDQSLLAFEEDRLKDLASLCIETIKRLEKAAESPKGIGLWRDFDRRTNKQAWAEKLLISQALSDLSEIFNNVLDEYYQIEHRKCHDYSRYGTHSESCMNKGSTIHDWRIEWSRIISIINTAEKLQDSIGKDIIEISAIENKFKILEGIDKMISSA